MNRLAVIQKIIDTKRAKTYLEIGIHYGQVFFNVNVPMKFGVDPNFPFDVSIDESGRRIFEDGKLYQMTSDKFFSVFAPTDLKDGLDVVFIDGLHTYKQSLIDVKNSLKFMNPSGVIIMHDCNPLSAATAYPVEESIEEVLSLAKKWEIAGWNNCWNGDVWKALVHLRAEYDDLDIFTLDLDWGLGIITSGIAERHALIDVDKISKLDYSFLEMNRKDILNLKHPKYLKNFCRRLRDQSQNNSL